MSEESLYHHIGEAVREGVSQERVLRMVTINAAKSMGVEDRIGSLEEGVVHVFKKVSTLWQVMRKFSNVIFSLPALSLRFPESL